MLSVPVRRGDRIVLGACAPGRESEHFSRLGFSYFLRRRPARIVSARVLRAADVGSGTWGVE